MQYLQCIHKTDPEAQNFRVCFVDIGLIAVEMLLLHDSGIIAVGVIEVNIHADAADIALP